MSTMIARTVARWTAAQATFIAKDMNFFVKNAHVFPYLQDAVPVICGVTSSAAAIEVDFGVASKIITPARGSLGAAIFECSLLLKLNPDMLPQSDEFDKIPVLPAATVREALSSPRFDGENFLKTSLLSSGSRKRNSVDDSDSDTTDNSAESDEDNDDLSEKSS